jgi:hypothetical protein
MIDGTFGQAGREQLPSLRHAVLIIEGEFEVTLPTHFVGSVTLNLSRLYASP